MNCPKCNKPRNKTDKECPYCGVLFSKINPIAKPQTPPDEETIEKSPFNYKYAGIAVLIISCGLFFISSRSSDMSADINSIVMSEVALGNLNKAKNLVEVEYKHKTDRPQLYRFWNLYIDSCQTGDCLKVISDIMDLKKPNEINAYKAVQEFTSKRLKTPTTATFEPKEFLSQNGTIGDQFSFSFTVDSENSFGARLRLNCHSIVQNVGEGDWFLSTLDCD